MTTRGLITYIAAMIAIITIAIVVAGPMFDRSPTMQHRIDNERNTDHG